MIENAQLKIGCELKLILKHCKKVFEFFPGTAENTIIIANGKLPYIHKSHILKSACLDIEGSRLRKVLMLFSILSADAQLCQR